MVSVQIITLLFTITVKKYIIFFPFLSVKRMLRFFLVFP